MTDKPLGNRLLMAGVYIALYALVWGLGLWRPIDVWVNGVIVGAILISHLPPLPARPFLAAAAWLAVCGVLYFVVNVSVLAVAIMLALGFVPSLLDAMRALQHRDA